MKTLRLFFCMLGVVCMSLGLSSCLNDDDSYSLGDMWVAIATVVPESDHAYYLRLDGGDKMWPAATNYPNYQPKTDQRALVNFTILADSSQSNLGGFSHYIKVNAIHNILTKPIAKNEGADNDKVYGTDPVSIPNNESIWVGDGYLNIYFMTDWGGQKAHFINLIQPDAEKDPYTLEFRHNAFDDPKVTSSAGRVAFNLSSLPDTQGKTVELSIKVKTYQGDQIYKVKYNTDKSVLKSSAPNCKDDGFSNMTNLQ